MPAIYMVSLGCAKNLVDSEIFLGETLGDAFELALEPEDADFVIINTCGFLAEARQEGREVIEEFLELKKSRKKTPLWLAAAGCWAERQPEALARDFPGLDAIWGLRTPSDLAERILEIMKSPPRPVTAPWSGGPTGKGDGVSDNVKPRVDKHLRPGKGASRTGPAADAPLPPLTASGLGHRDQPRDGGRLVTTLPSFAYLRLSDGCDNRCAYCAIPLIRGPLRSRRPEAVVEEARVLADQGAGELVLISQDTTIFGRDLGDAGKGGLAGLLEQILAAVAEPRIRVLYAHPAHLDDATMNLLCREERLCRYLDLPIQHVSDPILAAMNRGYGRKRIMEIIEKLAAVEDFTLRTTILAGFPGESEDDFLEVLNFVAEGHFRHLGAFAYSPENGTPAAGLPDAVASETAVRRRDEILAAQAEVAFAWLNGRVGGREEVLLDAMVGADTFLGRSCHEAPDADGIIYVTDECGECRVGERVSACITGRDGYDLLGKTYPGRQTPPGKEKARRRKR